MKGIIFNQFVNTLQVWIYRVWIREVLSRVKGIVNHETDELYGNFYVQ